MTSTCQTDSTHKSTIKAEQEAKFSVRCLSGLVKGVLTLLNVLLLPSQISLKSSS